MRVAREGAPAPEQVIEEVLLFGPEELPFIRTGQALRAYIVTGREDEGTPPLRALLKRKLAIPRRSARWVERLGMSELAAAAYLLSRSDLPIVRQNLDAYNTLIAQEDAEEAAYTAAQPAAPEDEEDEEDDEVSPAEASLHLGGLLRETPRITARALADLLETGQLRPEIASEIQAFREEFDGVDEDAVRQAVHSDTDTTEEDADAIANALLKDRDEVLSTWSAVNALVTSDVRAFRKALTTHGAHAEYTDWSSFPELEWLALGKKAGEQKLALAPGDFVGWERPFVSFALRRD